MRTQTCTTATREGRLKKAREFLDGAVTLDTVIGNDRSADAYVSLCILAGIAAADVICCAKLGEHAQGERHSEAIALLEKADKPSARHLRTLLSLKTKSGYSSEPTSGTDRKRAGRAAEALLQATIDA